MSWQRKEALGVALEQYEHYFFGPSIISPANARLQQLRIFAGPSHYQEIKCARAANRPARKAPAAAARRRACGRSVAAVATLAQMESGR